MVAADSALHRKLTSKQELREVLAACQRWRGIRRATEVVEFADLRAESPLESIARVVFRDCGLPPPDLQVWLGGVAEPVGRVDFYWKRYLTVAEVDGDMKYQDPARAKAQLRRDSLLRSDGYEVVHLDWQEVTGAPDYVAAMVRGRSAAGSAHCAPPADVAPRRAMPYAAAPSLIAADGRPAALPPGAAAAAALPSRDHSQRTARLSIAVRMRFSETGIGVPST